jgi:hypothetical protein
MSGEIKFMRHEEEAEEAQGPDKQEDGQKVHLLGPEYIEESFSTVLTDVETIVH